MIIKKQRICDVCGEEITNKHNSLRIKAKRGWSTWDIDGYEKITIDICPSCVGALKEHLKTVSESIEAKALLIENMKQCKNVFGGECHSDNE